MEVIKLGKKGQVSLPSAILRKLGLEGSATLLVDTTDDGAVILRPAAVYPIERYSDARIAEFERENAIPEKLATRVEQLAAKRRKKPR
jgi:AbrB family looped-hinge helix DNA binding protein